MERGTCIGGILTIIGVFKNLAMKMYKIDHIAPDLLCFFENSKAQICIALM